MFRRKKAKSPFPDLAILPSLKLIYQAFFIHFGRLTRLTLLPWLASTFIYMGGDYYMAQSYIDAGQFSFVSLCVQALQLLIFFLFSLSVFRLMLLGNYESHLGFDADWRARYWHYAVRYVRFFGPLIGLVLVSLIILRLVAQVSLPFLPYALLFIVFALAYAASRLNFTLPAAAVDAPYKSRDSWHATQGASLKILLIFLLAIAPILILLFLFTLIVNAIQPSIELLTTDDLGIHLQMSYFYLVPISMYLTYLSSSLLLISSAILFYSRTRWRPGSVRTDL